LNDSQQTYKNITSQIEAIDFAIKNVQFEGPEIEVEIDETKDELFRFRRQFLDYLDSDFNTAGAIGILFDFNSFINKHLHSRKAGKDSLAEYKKLLLEFCDILGIVVKGKGSIGQNIQAKIDERESARKNKDFKRADEIRNELQAHGIILEDTPYGVKWSKNA
jgi:cysteinyl-tRNA synthetase